MYCRFDDPARVAERIATLPREPDEHVLALIGREHADQLEALRGELLEREVPFLGAVVPGLVHGDTHRADGVVARPLALVGPPVIADLSGPGVEWRGELPTPPAVGACTMLVLVDFMSPRISDLLDELYDHYGNRASYLGGGVGLGVRREADVLLTPDGVRGSAAVVAMLHLGGPVIVRHGWQRLHGPLVATRTSGSVIEELNWEPAVEIYERFLGPRTPQSIDTPDEIPAIKRFPFGIAREGEEDVVRDPLRFLDQGGLECLSAVPEHSVMHILHAEPESLIGAAEQAMLDCLEHLARPPRHALLFDCYSRLLLLGDRLEDELGAMNDRLCERFPGCELEGAFALGEIASDGERRPQFHNKTVGVGLLDG